MPRIAYLGPEHTNTHLAALKRFGRLAQYVHAPTVDDVFHLVEREQADYGVVPIENSLEGAVTHTLDRFIDFKVSPVQIHGEIEQPIRHYLIVPKHAKLSDVGVVLSHPQALAQCAHWLDRHLSKVVLRSETGSTAEAVKRLLNAEESSRPLRLITGIRGPVVGAAIARRELARGGLRAIPIPESRENKTRFLILGLGESSKKGRRNKTSILFALKDKPGALYDALSPFKRGRINLTKIESRPSKKKAWEYYFFIDLEGHESEPRVRRALKTLARHVDVLKVLGSYPVTR
ncbi:MAG: prephenate dehydratase [Candidatus Omnitrophica bacterium]|nr:prephenate dehydratase [Candidatus Omnitrophota bacterium]